MKVLINALQAGNRSGTGRYVTELVRALAANPEDLELTVVWPETEAIDDLGGHVSVIKKPAHSLRRILTDHWTIQELCARQGIDVIHYPANFGPLLPLRNVVVTVHDLSFMRHPEWFKFERALYYRWALRHTVRTVKRLIADSEATAADLVQFASAPREKIDVIPLGVHPRFRPASCETQTDVRAKYRLPERFFLYVGTLEPRKNIPRLIEAWSSMAHDTDADLVIAGRRGWKTQAIDTAVSRSSFSHRIHFLEYLPDIDLPAVMSAALAFVWPSLFEGFGLPPLEAMACGTPVLTSNVSSMPEIVGEAALIVDPEDPAAIAQGLRQLAEDKTLRKTLRDKGLTRILTFTWERSAALTLNAYREVVR
ncbi:MAG TPA: glycosyltransferase family 1 protein [Candidatus Hydrogenedentes bacterium]|nr:glycosyltransferase family 1 protein [Candidatus Hydrogenedentota bacterium]